MGEEASNPLRKLSEYGQSIWLDYLSRDLIESGEFERLIEEDGLRGVTSNPTIFDKAIAGSSDYDATIERLARQGKRPEAICEAIVIEEVQRAADLLRPVYDRLEGRDGFVSLEVSPRLARDEDGTLAEARHLWNSVDRPNVMIKVPGTREGIPVIQQLISEGVNVNITLLFALPRYHQVAEAYLAGLEARVKYGEHLRHVASVASFFLSRIDTLIDPMLEAIVRENRPRADAAKAMRGQVAIACAKMAYDMYKTLVDSQRFRNLAERGARPQRLLWASTSTKDPTYSDVMYVDALIGPDTINTLPLETLHAYRSHGHPAPRLEENVLQASNTIEALSEMGIDLEQVAQQLEDEGIRKFSQSWDHLLKTIQEKAAAITAKA